ncbi:somatotropin-like [Hypomesus transpacificus]|uniref:somatotropin-like n=1 Tax=Hypomesus transpacificus TaxID=137520 RepID=UPI001F07E16F|nr:somatotropin-like [Hypomesus transpacificus]
MGQVFLLLTLLLVSDLVRPASGSENQRLFSIAVDRAQHLHLLAQKMFNDFEGNLSTEDRRQMNKIFLQDFCNSDSIISPVDKHETQKSSVQKLLHISFRLVESWEYPSQTLSSSLTLSRFSEIPLKLTDLKIGIDTILRGTQDGIPSLEDNEAQQLPPYENYYQNLGGDDNIRRSYELLACFKKDMHKVETYLTVAKCRRSLEANCTL